jgi:hypothetical protein
MLQKKATDQVRGCIVLRRNICLLVDDFRRRQPLIPTRNAAVAELIKRGLASLAKDVGEQRGAVR